MHHLHFNHLALLVSAIIQWLIGGLWYSVLFKKSWMALTGYVRPESDERRKNAIVGLIVSFIVSFILSLILAHVVIWSGSDSFATGMLVGFICWMGFIAGPFLAQQIYEERPGKLWAIDVGYWLVAMLISGGLLSVWR